jgi:hypothetical protein
MVAHNGRSGMSTEKINSTLLPMTLAPVDEAVWPGRLLRRPMNRAVKAAASEMAVCGGEDRLRLRE